MRAERDTKGVRYGRMGDWERICVVRWIRGIIKGRGKISNYTVYKLKHKKIVLENGDITVI